jgi:hypothetical protein
MEHPLPGYENFADGVFGLGVSKNTGNIFLNELVSHDFIEKRRFGMFNFENNSTGENEFYFVLGELPEKFSNSSENFSTIPASILKNADPNAIVKLTLYFITFTY